MVTGSILAWHSKPAFQPLHNSAVLGLQFQILPAGILEVIVYKIGLFFEKKETSSFAAVFVFCFYLFTHMNESQVPL